VKKSGLATEKIEPIVNEHEIATIVQSWTGIPVTKLVEAESQKLLRMEEDLHNRIIGQDDAVVAVSRAIRRARSGLKDPKRAYGQLQSSWDPPASEKPSWQKRLRLTFTKKNRISSESTCPSTWSGLRSADWLAPLQDTLDTMRADSLPNRCGAILLRSSSRRNREGAPRGIQHPSAGDGRWPT